MMTVILPYPDEDGDFDRRHGGPSTWRDTLTSAPRVWDMTGTPLHTLDGQPGRHAASVVREVIKKILDDPGLYARPGGAYDLQATIGSMVALYFMLRAIPDGIVQVF